MKALIKLFWWFYRMVVFFLYGLFVYYAISYVKAGTETLSSAILYIVGGFIICRLLTGRIGATLFVKLCNFDPFKGIEEDRRNFNARWNAAMARKAEDDKKAAAEARARYQAESNARWHEYYAKQYAGTNDGYYHENMAKKYWDEAR